MDNLFCLIIEEECFEVVLCTSQWFMEDSIKKISIRGRMYFCLQCLQNAFGEKNRRDEKFIGLILKTVKDFLRSEELDKWEESAENILPVNLLDSKFNINDYTMDHSLVLKLKLFYEQLPPYLTDLIDYTLNVGLNNLYGGTGEYSSFTLDPVLKVITICKQNNIKIPDISNFLKFSFNEEHGWGNTIRNV